MERVFFRTLNSVSYCKRRILKVKNNIRCFFLNVQSFLRPVCFEKQIGSVSLKRQLKRREEIWITKRTLWCYFQVYLSQKKRKGAEQRQCFKATHFIKRPSFQGQGVDLDTNIEGRIQENVRIVFTSKNNEMWLNIFFFFFFLHCSFTDIYTYYEKLNKIDSYFIGRFFSLTSNDEFQWKTNNISERSKDKNADFLFLRKTSRQLLMTYLKSFCQ